MFKNKNLIKVLAATVLIGMSFTSCTHLIEKIKDLAGGDDDGYENTNSGNSGSSNGQSTGTKNTPVKNAVALTADSWTTTSISSSENEKWFSFYANAYTLNFFIKDNSSNLTFYLYDNTNKQVGESFTAYSSDSISNKVYTNLTSGTYYIKVTTYSSYASFKIGFTGTPAQPETIITPLTTMKQWISDEIEYGEEKWYSFSPANGYNNNYVWVKPGTLSGYSISTYENFTQNGQTETTYSTQRREYTAYASYGKTGYIKLTCTSYSEEGTYQIAWNKVRESPDSSSF